MAYKYTNGKGQDYFLHSKEVQLKGSGKNQRIFYFAKDVRNNEAMDDVPSGYKVVENPKTGLPIIKKQP